jgi:hypothetical protein
MATGIGAEALELDPGAKQAKGAPDESAVLFPQVKGPGTDSLGVTLAKNPLSFVEIAPGSQGLKDIRAAVEAFGLGSPGSSRAEANLEDHIELAQTDNDGGSWPYPTYPHNRAASDWWRGTKTVPAHPRPQHPRPPRRPAPRTRSDG